MHIKSLVSVVALSTVFAFSGPAFAQTMFAGAALSEADLGAVTERCEQLVTASTTASATDSATGDSSTDDTAGGSDANVDEAPEVNELEAATSTIDLDTVTIEQCTEAGLGGAM